MKLKAGYGYWETSSAYPIGGCFRRAGGDGKEITRLIRYFKPYKGCNMEVEFDDKSTGAVNDEHIEKDGMDPCLNARN